VGLVRKLVFSPDGGSLFFGAENGPTEGHRIFQISAGGGPPHAVVQGTAWLQQIVPGSNKILYLRAAEKDDVLYLSDSQGAHEQRILARLRPDRITAAEVSPDGKTIAFWWLVGNRNELHYALYTTNLGGTVETALGAEKWPVTYPRPELVWGPGGSELLVTSEEQQNRRQVYRVGYPAGGRERITDGLANYSSIRLTADGGTLFAVASERVEQIWTMDPRRPGSERLVTDRFPGLSQLVWSRDGRLVATGVGLWVVDPKTGATRQIPGTAAGDGYPSVTADGQSVLFASKRDGRSALWQVGLDGEHLQLIGEGVAPGRPKLARNGRWLVYSDFADDAISIWKRPLGPGQPAQRISFGDPATEPEVSPNGTQVLAVRPSRNLVVIYPIEGGPPVKTIALPGLAADLVAWSADGSAVHFLAPYEGVVNIWSQPIAGGQPQPVTRLPKPRVASFSWSPEGVLALARVQSSSDVAVIRGYSGADRPPGVLARIGWAASPH
jgi:Tol biopolymer transport system component